MIEPTALTGLLATYQLCPVVSVNAGIVNTWSAGLNSRAFSPYGTKAESFKTYLGSLTFTAPTNTGFLAGSTLSAGVINGYDAVNVVNKTSWYVGGTVNTPVTNLKAGFAVDYVNLSDNAIGGPAHSSGYQGSYGLYLSYQATEKLGLYTRGEYLVQSGYLVGTGAGDGLPGKSFEVTETVQYDLWKNVLARLEFRWDHSAGTGSGPEDPFSNGVDNAFLLAANIVYKF
jgi:hypothetical protein